MVMTEEDITAASVEGRRMAIIGATGFVGSHLAERLLAQGASVLAIARSERRADNLSAVRQACELVLCDLTTGPELEAAIARFRPDTLIHLAAHADASENFVQMADCLRTNALGVVRVLEIAARHGVGLFVFGDSSKVYGHCEPPFREAQPPAPVCSYAIAKAAAWQMCQLAASLGGPRVVGLRPTLIYGPRQNANLIEHVRVCALAGRSVHLLGGRQTRDPLFVSDAVEAFVQATLCSNAVGHSIPIGGGCEVSVLSLVHAVVETLGVALQVYENEVDMRPTEILRSGCDNEEAARLLGWRPRVGLAEGLALTLVCRQ